MKTRRARLSLAVAIALTAVGTHQTRAAAAAVATGTIEGRVFNVATSTALVNARVSVEGSDRVVLTDEGGAFQLDDVPVGPVRLSVRYLGLEPQTVLVEVRAGDRVQREIELAPRGIRQTADKQEVVRMQQFTVVADQEMSAQAVAMNEQRNAPNLKNVVAIGEFGDRGAENIGEFLQFLPGVAIVNSGIEPIDVSLRGLPSGSGALTIDGGSVASFRDNRSADLRAVPMANISRVEITKVPTPDMPASGLGGAINLITKTGFETKRPQFTYQIYAPFHNSDGLTLRGGPRHHIPQNTARWKEPSIDFSYSHPVNKSLAVTIGGSSTWRMTPMTGGDDETANWDLFKGALRASNWTSLVQLNKTRSGSAGVEWRISPSDNLSLSAHQRNYSLTITRSTMITNFGANAIGGPGYTYGVAPGTGYVDQGYNWRIQRYDSRQFTARYRHRGRLWRIDASGAWSRSSSPVSDIDEGMFNSVRPRIANVVIRGDGIPASLKDGVTPRRFSAVNRSGVPVDLYDGENYSIPSGVSNQSDRKGTAGNVRLDVARDLKGAMPVTLKAGVAADRTTNDAKSEAKTWSFRPNGASDETSRLARNFDVFDEAFLATAPTIYGVPYREISLKKVYELFVQHPEWFVLDQAGAHQNRVTDSRGYEETVTAAYVRADARLLSSRLWLVAGVRFERTDNEGWGPLDDINAQYQRDASGNFIRSAAGQKILITNDTLALRQLRYKERAAHVKRDYSGYYPSLNATYNITDNLLLRAAYARTIGRPRLNYITPGTTISAPEVASPTITVSNTNLQPWTADNYDFTLESVNFKDGFGSVGVFRKDIRNFFGQRRIPATSELLEFYSVPTDGSYDNYEIVTRENVGDARVTGVEFSYRQSLSFLPSWARGFQVFFNLTKLRVEGSNYGDFLGFNPTSLSGGINWLRERFFIKTTFNYQGEIRTGLVTPSVANGIPENTYDYQGKRTRIGINAQYTLNRRFSIFASTMDAGGYTWRTYRYAPDTPEYAKGLRRTVIGYFVTLGVKGTF